MVEPTLALAVAAGVVSFLSPCMLPVIPTFFAQLAGTSLNAPELRRRDVFFNAVLFVARFSAVFAVLGVLLNATLQGAATEVLTWLSRVARVIVLGLPRIGPTPVAHPRPGVLDEVGNAEEARLPHLSPIRRLLRSRLDPRRP